MHPSDIPKNLGRFEIFTALDQPQLTEMSALVQVVRFAKGVTIFDDHEPSDRIYLICSGIVSIHVFSITPAYDITLSQLRAGEVLGEFALVDSRERSASATCTEEVEALAIDVADLNDYMEENPRVGYLIMRKLSAILAGRVKAMNRRLLNVTRTGLFQ